MRRKERIQLWVLAVIIGVWSICGIASPEFLASHLTNMSQDKADAGKLFNGNCAKCHGKDGRAKTFRGKLVGARNLTDEPWQAQITDEQIAAAIKKGPKEMPAFEQKLTPAEIEALVSYVRHFKQGKAAPTEK